MKTAPKLALLALIPEKATFQVATPHTIGGGEHFEKGGCQLTLLPNHAYTVKQALTGFSVANGICHVEQRSKTFGNVDELKDVSFTIDDDIHVIPLAQTNG